MTLDQKQNYLYVNGDSWSYGYGLEEDTRIEKCWPGIVARHFNLTLINDSLPGCSNHRIIRTTVKRLEEFKDQEIKPLILLPWTDISRYELCRSDTNEWDQFTVNSTKNKTLVKEINNHYISDEGNTEVFITQLIMLQSYLRESGFKFLTFPTFRIPYAPIEYVKRLAKRIDMSLFLHDFSLRGYLQSFNDLEWLHDQHPGEEGHQLIAEFLIRQIQRRNMVGGTTV